MLTIYFIRNYILRALRFKSDFSMFFWKVFWVSENGQK